jgi:pre-rRNA-processing protein TSR3
MDRLATIVVHHKERRSKCTLESLRDRAGLTFVDPRPDEPVDATGHVVLDVEAPPLTASDAGRPLMILDATWRLQPALRRALTGAFVSRSLPSDLVTAYPRRSKLSPDPDPARGLASVEALFAALCILGHRDESLLDHYRWKDTFLHHCRNAGIPGPARR